MAVHFVQSSPFKAIRAKIEEHLFNSVFEIEKDFELAVKSVALFNDAIYRLMDMLEQMYQSPQPKDHIGEKSFPIREGRYRVFFKVVVKGSDFEITFTDIDDNRQSNLDRFPQHQMIEFDSEE